MRNSSHMQENASSHWMSAAHGRRSSVGDRESYNHGFDNENEDAENKKSHRVRPKAEGVH